VAARTSQAVRRAVIKRRMAITISSNRPYC
jgi:hypothetical protein